MTHVTDSWTRHSDKQAEPYYTLLFIGGLASSLFLFLAGVATTMSAASKARREGSAATGAALARRRGWEIFVLGLVFRVQALVLGFAPILNLFKVDMLNVMGLSIVAASWVWQASESRRARIALFAVATTAIAMATPLVRAMPRLAALPDPIEAYLRPAGGFAAFPFFPWSGFLFAGALVGELVDAVRSDARRQQRLQPAIAAISGTGVVLAWLASFRPSIYAQADFWHSSPTFFFIRLGLVALTVPAAWAIETGSQRLHRTAWLQPLVTMGRSSLFVYWIHIEMVYGVIAEPIKATMPLWATLLATAGLCCVLYAVVRVKNRFLERHELRGAFRVLAPVIR